MKRLLLTFSLLLTAASFFGQTITLVSPAGLEAPYEVAAGTEVTFEWDYSGSAPTAFFTHDEEPVFPDFGPDPEWTQLNSFEDNGDGTYSISIIIDEPTYVLGGSYGSFIMMWSFSNVVYVGISSGVEIASEDLYICEGSGDEEVLSASEAFDSYQWFLNGEAIEGATSQSYSATEAGSYKVQVPVGEEMVFSNTLTLSYPTIETTGVYNGTLQIYATEGFDSYQWLSGSTASELSEINGETENSINVTIPSVTTYFAVEGVIDGCVVSSDVKEVSAENFAIPEITLSADTNSSDVVCAGTEITVSTSGNYGSYNWLQDGWDAGYTSNSVSITQNYQTGGYSVEVSPVDWPEITLTSEVVSVTYYTPVQPVLSGVESFGTYCPGETINITLGDEGYQYDWYAHQNYNYSEEDMIDVSGTTYTFDFNEQTYVTVVANYQGCSSSSMVTLNSYEDENLSISVSNYDQTYLCTDSTAWLAVDSWSADQFENFQWKELVNGEYVNIEGETDSDFETGETGTYVLEASVVACPSVTLTSQEIIIYDYTERELIIFADEELLCMGESTNLNLSGDWEWQAIQWFEEDIQMGSSGYEEIFTPIVGGGSSGVQEVTEFNSYLAKARHQSCPNGLKNTSNIVNIKPRVNPVITPEPNYGVDSWAMAPYDSIAFYTFCQGEPVTLNVSGEYESYEWYVEQYSGDGGYVLGAQIEGALSNSTDILADGATWYTAMVDSAGCVGLSDPILIDTHVFQGPSIASYDNAELCEPGDSTLLHIAFPGNWGYIEWYRNGNLVPDSNNDSLYAFQEGEYTVTAYPEICPEFGYSSGVGPYVSFLEASIVEDEDLIYAWPHEGFYSFQWYLDGEPIASVPATPWIQFKEDMPAGVYTVEITNPTECTALSNEFIWNPTSVDEFDKVQLSVFPNPASGMVQIQGVNYEDIKSFAIYNLQGKNVTPAQLSNTLKFDVSELSSGVYMVEFTTRNNIQQRVKLVRK